MDKPTDIDLESFLLWREFTKDIDPMRQKNWEQEEEFLLQCEAVIPVTSSSVQEKSSESARVDLVRPEKQVQAIHFQLDRRTEEKLRKGKMPIDGTLDLHGLNQSQAHAALENAVLMAVAQKKRCLLVITGKGNTGRTGDDWITLSAGVLKSRVPEWLSVPPFSYHVLKFVQAKPNHGGSGALYVYLRRSR